MAKKTASKAKTYKFKPAKKTGAASAAPRATKAPANNFGVGVWPAVGFTSPTPQKSMEQAMNKTQSQYDAFSKDANAYMQENMNALSKSGKICAERMQDMMSTCMELCQGASEKQANALKNMMACKTINEVTDCQTKLAQQSFDEMMSAWTKLTEMGVKCATEVMEPLNDQIGKAVKKATDSMAA